MECVCGVGGRATDVLVGTLLVGLEAATGAYCGRVGAAATGAAVGSRPRLIFQRSSASSSAEA